jgi:hypothetical protein
LMTTRRQDRIIPLKIPIPGILWLVAANVLHKKSTIFIK